VFKDRTPRRAKNATNLEKKRIVEKINGGDNSTNLENIDPDKRAIHIHGGMEHNLAKYAKYYSCGITKISKGNEFTRKFDYNRRDFFGHW
jgi:hypothetical protein